jgi:hypothetical protein
MQAVLSSGSTPWQLSLLVDASWKVRLVLLITFQCWGQRQASSLPHDASPRSPHAVRFFVQCQE